MAEPLKHFFDAALVRAIADSFVDVWPAFPRATFVRSASRGLDALELKGRAAHIADALALALPQAFAEAAPIMMASLGPKHATDELEGVGMTPFFYLPHTMWVAKVGLEHFELAMQLQRELTQRFTCEFSIRSFLERYPDATMRRLSLWTRDPSPHVRRLASEGTRQRLPWASRVRVLDQEPERILSLLEGLRDDPSSMVRRSVANSLNDLGKSAPDLVYPVLESWLEDATAERRKLVQHALRSAVKRGESRALALLGHGAAPDVEATAAMKPKRVAIGQKVCVSITVRSTSSGPQSLNLDLEVLFVKARGARPKVFKLRRVELEPHGVITLTKSISLEVHTTRKPNPGKHVVALLANGSRTPLGHFTVTD